MPYLARTTGSTKLHGKSVSVRGPCPGMIVGRVSRRAERSGRLTVGGPLGRPRYSPTNCGQITLRSAGPLYSAVHAAAAAAAAAQSVGRRGHGPHQDAEPHNSGGCGSNAPHLHAGPPPRRGIKYAASARPLPRRPRLLSSPLPRIHGRRQQPATRRSSRLSLPALPPRCRGFPSAGG